MKPAQERVEPASNGGETIDDVVETLHERTARVLLAQMERIERQMQRFTRYDADLGAESANLARALATVTAEVRKRDAYLKVKVAKLSPQEQDDLVRGYIAELPAERRAVLVAWMGRLP